MTKLRPNNPIARRLSNGWMAQLALEHRKATNIEIEHIILVTARACITIEKAAGTLDKQLENVLEATRLACEKAGCNEEDWKIIQIKIVNKVYGDPLVMMESLKQRQFSLPFWNPTKHKLNVAPMGLVKSYDRTTGETIYYDFIEPGEYIMIPEHYTKGNKYSTIYGVAPQLKPIPREIDTTLDASPITFTEWCTFGDVKNSACCNKLPVWMVKLGYLGCSKCGAPQ